MNTAGRLLALFDRLTGTGRANDMVMVKVWAEVFDLPVDEPQLEDDVVTCLQATRSEMDVLRTKLMLLGAPEELMHPGMARFRSISSASLVNQSWVGIKEEISRPENRLSFAWANWILREEDEEIMAEDELAVLRSELDSLEKSLQETEMASYLHDFIKRQIEAIRAALRVYRVQGVKPIEKALQQVAGAYTIEKTRVEAEHEKASEPAKSVLARTGAFIEKTAKLADQLDKIRKAGEGAYTLAASVTPMLVSFGHSLLTRASS